MKKTQQLTLNFDEDATSKKDLPKPGATNKFQAIGGLFDRYKLEDKGGYITKEFQDFGYRLALELDDMPHKSLYMRLAKSTNRAVLEQALSFVADAPSVKSKAKLFMWRLKQLKEKPPAPPKKNLSKTDKT